VLTCVYNLQAGMDATRSPVPVSSPEFPLQSLTEF
jgi:hypothetical protein